MKISSNLSKEEISKIQHEFYEYFQTGYEFEYFLKEYLLKMGFDEVEKTPNSRDGGIDLKAIRKGVGDFSDIDNTTYYIQAKRYAPSNKIGVSKIRELKGTIDSGCKGMLITTSDFTSDAVIEARNKPTPVVLINGEDLIMSCIDNEIGFLFKPIFSKNQMDLFLKRNHLQNNPNPSNNNLNLPTENIIEKWITSNDIRARIISIPSSIMKQFEEKEKSEVKVLVNNTNNYIFSINKGRNYFGRVTDFLRDYNMLSDEGIISPKQSKWIYDSENDILNLYIEE